MELADKKTCKLSCPVMHVNMFDVEFRVLIWVKYRHYSQTRCSIPLNIATLQPILQFLLAVCYNQIATGTCELPHKLSVSIFQVRIISFSFKKKYQKGKKSVLRNLY